MKITEENGWYVVEIGESKVRAKSLNAAIIAAAEQAIEDLGTFDGKKIVHPPFDEIQAWTIGIVKGYFENLRGNYITLLPGKISEYAQKKREYDDWVLAGSPVNPNPVTFLIAEAERKENNSLSLAEMLQVYGDKDDLWRKASAGIAANERRALVGVAQAVNEEAIIAVLVELME